MTCITRATRRRPTARSRLWQPVYGQPVYRDDIVTRPVVRTAHRARRVASTSRAKRRA